MRWNSSAASQHVLPAGFQKVRHYGFLSPNSGMSIEAVRWLVTLHNGQCSCFWRSGPKNLPHSPCHVAPRAAARWSSWDSYRLWHHSIRANPMTNVTLFETRPSMALRGQSPIGVRARIGFTSNSGRPGDDLAVDKTPRHTQQQGSSHLSLPFKGRFPLL
jgi:hypothetical protein